MHDNLEVDASVEEMENLESDFAIIIQERIANDSRQERVLPTHKTIKLRDEG